MTFADYLRKIKYDDKEKKTMTGTAKTKRKEKMPNVINSLYFHAKNNDQEGKLINLVNNLVSVKGKCFSGKALILDYLLRNLPQEIEQTKKRLAQVN